MKKLIAIFLLMLSASAFAQHHGHHGHGYGFRPYSWIGPTIIGGVIGYEIARQQPIYIQQQPIYVQQQPVIIQQSPQVCTDWKEIQQSDGRIYRERTCTQ
jgi:hypothetical protein